MKSSPNPWGRLNTMRQTHSEKVSFGKVRLPILTDGWALFYEVLLNKVVAATGLEPVTFFVGSRKCSDHLNYAACLIY